MGHQTVGRPPAILGWLAAVVVVCSTPAHAQRNLEISAKAAEPRVALVIGNAAYGRGPLRNPVNDARAVSTKLERLGFVVIKRENLRAKEIGSTLREFRSRLSPGAVALFFYAGHGVQIRGVNYLPTVDAEIDAEEDVPTQSIDLNKVMEVMEDAKARVNLVFLDACRDNPFARKFRSAANGLAKVDAPSGTLIAFATRPGSVAADGDGQNGLYTQHLLRHMDEPGLPIEQLLKQVGRGVKLASKGRQEPWSEGLIEGDFFFRTAAGAATASAPAQLQQMDPAALDALFWDSVKGSSSPEDYREYLRQFPNGRFAALAQNRLKSLSATPPLPPRPTIAPVQPPTQVAMAAPSRELRSLSIGTGGTGGVYYPLGGSIASLLSRHLRGLTANAEVTGGSVANLQLIATGKPYLGMTMADALLDAYRGQDRFAGKPVPVRTLAVLYPNRMHLVSVAGRGVTAISDLKSKRISTGSGGSATEVMALRILEAAGIDKERDIRRERLGVAESVNALRDGRIDAFFWVGGVPTMAVADLANTPGMQIKMIDHAHLVPIMNGRYGRIYLQEVMARDVYRGMDSAHNFASVMNLLVAHQNLDDAHAYDIVKTIFENRNDLIASHREAENIRLEWQSTYATPIPFHPGAIRYYAEKGIAIR